MFRFFRTVLTLTIAAVLIYLLALPDVRTLRHHNPQQTSLMELRVEQAQQAGKTIHSQMIWRNLDEISPNLVHAVLVAEDDTFYQHSGFDLDQIRVAVHRDWDKGQFVYGGSTLTQQLARTLYLSPRKNLLRKAKEALITVLLEHTLSKRRIFELYLNVVEWGKGIYGAQAASQMYFHCDARDLTPDQAVALASILPSPRRWSPLSERAFMARRRTQLIERMKESGYWPEEEMEISTTTLPSPSDPFSVFLQ